VPTSLLCRFNEKSVDFEDNSIEVQNISGRIVGEGFYEVESCTQEFVDIERAIAIVDCDSRGAEIRKNLSAIAARMVE